MNKTKKKSTQIDKELAEIQGFKVTESKNKNEGVRILLAGECITLYINFYHQNVYSIKLSLSSYQANNNAPVMTRSRYIL